MLQRHRSIAEQMKDLLRERILQREFEPSGRLPSEAQLAADFSVSRATVRTALASLAAEGLIVRRHGDGTYVNQRVLEVTTRLDSVWEFTKLIEASGRRSSIQILEEIDRPASKNEASALGIPAGSPVLVLKRLFYADERPIILSENVLPRELVCKPYSVEALTGSVLNFLRNYCEQEFSYAIADISAAAVEQNMHEFLHLATGQPILRLEEVFYNTADRPLVYAVNYLDDRSFRLRVVRSFI